MNRLECLEDLELADIGSGVNGGGGYCMDCNFDGGRSGICESGGRLG